MHTYGLLRDSSRLVKPKTYINIQPELLSKCKKLKELYICQRTKPEQALSNRPPCEIKLAAKQIINEISVCDIRLVKLDVTYWARTSSANVWAFSTGKKDRIAINCTKAADKTVTIHDVGLFELSPGCTARSNSVRLNTTREISTNFETTTYGGIILDIADILSNETINKQFLLKHVMSKSASSMRKGHTPTHVLETGQELREIIHRARNLEQYRSVTSRLATLKQGISYAGGSIVSLAIIGTIIWKLSPKGGRPLLIRKRMFSSHRAESTPFPPGAKTEMCHFRPRLRLGWQFTRDMDCPSFFLPRCVIYYFSKPKTNYRKSRRGIIPLRRNRRAHFQHTTAGHPSHRRLPAPST